MGILDLLKRSFRTTNANLMLVIGLFVYNVVINLIQLPVQAKFPAPGTPPTLPPGPWILVALLLWLVVMLLGIFIQGGLLEFTKGAIAKTEPEDVARFWEGGKKHYLKLLGFMALLLSYLLLLVVVAVTLGTATSALLSGLPVVGNVIAGIEIVMFILLGVLSFLFVVFSPYAIVVSARGVIGGIKTSIEFVKANFAKVTGLALLLIGIGACMGIAVGLVIGVAGAIFRALPLLGQIVSIILSSALSAYILFLGTAALMALYVAFEKKEAPSA